MAYRTRSEILWIKEFLEGWQITGETLLRRDLRNSSCGFHQLKYEVDLYEVEEEVASLIFREMSVSIDRVWELF